MGKGPELPRGGGRLRCYLVQFRDTLLRNVTVCALISLLPDDFSNIVRYILK